MRKLLFVIPLLGLLACGPDQTAQEKDDQQRRQILNKNTAVLQSLTGKYVGTVKDTQRNYIYSAILTLSIGTVYQPDPSRNQAAATPVLQGSLQYCSEENQKCIIQQDYAHLMTVSVFSIGNYAEDTQRLSLLPSAVSQARVEATVTNFNHIVGNITTGKNPNAGIIDVTKVN